ncbi:MAG: methylenetetrahydrofolate reductase [Bacillota bacterium]|nr:methylenetetrahydrofolate reductase [Bacillota bacterium]
MTEASAAVTGQPGPQLKSGSHLERIFEAGHFAVTAEIGPPKSVSSKSIREHAAMLRDYVDAVNLTDNQTAIVRLSSIAAAVHVMSEGVEPVVQITCRDRNRIAIQSDLLGAYSLGVRNLLCLSGDHQVFGNHPGSKNVYDIDSIQLIAAVRDLRDRGVFMSGEKCRYSPRMFIGAAANPFADPFEYRALRLAKKVAAGADFIQTQAVYDLERFEAWMGMVRDMGLHERVKIIAGVVPAKSAAALRYVSTVPGMRVPERLIDRIAGAADQAAEGVKICAETVAHLREIEGVAGVHIMAIAWEKIVPDIVQQAGLLPRPRFEARTDAV